jgi:hypothetical protein
MLEEQQVTLAEYPATVCSRSSPANAKTGIRTRPLMRRSLLRLAHLQVQRNAGGRTSHAITSTLFRRGGDTAGTAAMSLTLRDGPRSRVHHKEDLKRKHSRLDATT